MTQLAQQFSAHAGPTIVYLNFDGGTDNYPPNGGPSTTISKFVQLADFNREADIAAIINGVAHVFAPFNVEVERLYGAGSADTSNDGNTTVFIGPDSADSNSFTPGKFIDVPDSLLGYNHAPHSNPYNLAFVGDPTYTNASGNQYSTWGNSVAAYVPNLTTDIQQFVSKIAHEVGHTFGLEHVFTGNGTGQFSSSNPADMMAYDAPNVSFLDTTYTVTDANYIPSKGPVISGTRYNVAPGSSPFGSNFFAWWDPTGNDDPTTAVKITQQDSYTYLLAVLGPNMNQLAVVQNSSGGLESFAIGPNHDLIHQWQSAPGGAWSSWQTLGGYVQSFVVGTNANGLLEVFAIGGNNSMYVTQQVPGGIWTSWEDFHGYVRQLAVASNSAGNLEVFAIGQDYQVWHRYEMPANGYLVWSNWSSLPVLGAEATQIAVQSNKDGRLEVFGIGYVDNGLWHTSQASYGNSDEWNTWESLGGYVRQISAGKNSDGRLEVFAIGQYYALWHIWQLSANAVTATYWSNWSWLGGYVTSIVAYTNNHGFLNVFALGGSTDNSSGSVYVISQQSGGGWGGWSGYLGGRVHDLAVATDNSSGNTFLLGTGLDNSGLNPNQDGDLYTNSIGGWLGLPSGWKDSLQPAL
jgi:hypothetical protein